MNPYDILMLAEHKHLESSSSPQQEIESVLLQGLLEKNMCNKIVIQKYLRIISKKAKKIRKNASERELMDNHPAPHHVQELNNEGPCYYSQHKIDMRKKHQPTTYDNPQNRLASNSVTKCRPTKIRNTAHHRTFLRPVQPTALAAFFDIGTPTQSESSMPQKDVSKKQNMANELRKLLLKQVYSMHENINKTYDEYSSNEEQKKFSVQDYCVHKHLNIKKMGIVPVNQSRKIKTESAEIEKMEEIEVGRRLRASNLKQRTQQRDKLFPKVGGSHLQRNKRCLQIFLKYAAHKKKHNSNLFKINKGLAEEGSELKTFKLNTVPLKKQS